MSYVKATNFAAKDALVTGNPAKIIKGTELNSEFDAIATASGVSDAAIAAHIADSSAAHAASAVSNTPAGNIAATNVQTALNELDTEKLAISALGTGVQTALGVNVGTAGSPVVNGGALGTPSSGTLTNCTFPTLNQNTTGSSGSCTGNSATATSATTATTATNLAGGAGGSVPYQSASGTTAMLANGTSGQVLTSQGGTSAPQWTTAPGTGTVTSASVVSANGFAGTVATATTTPAITLTTSVNGVLVGNGTAVAAAVSGTDFKTINSTSILGSGNIATLVAGGALGTPSSGTLSGCTGYASSALTGVPLTAQATGFTASGGATPKTLTVDDDLTTSQAARRNAANTFSAQQTFTETADTVHTITDGAAFEIDPANGNIQVVTLGANRTPAATNFESGQAILLGVDDGTAYTLDFATTIGVVWNKVGGTAAAPTLAATGYTWIMLWKVGSTVYGVEVGQP